ncbi:chitin biosynthesis protein (Chs5), putative [Talaromyces stipitatus ATCC 10500]|uniref:Chitin biosynthesis protein (Chs5), putative n=1 Tax=Talaromyces stipitatus (strain ATCC 10500 / CBS 375.48 / QM 6759 / NRRL 1006) TaxID=441959 RepID=B8M4U8_TALSN|nr:chitin biosynthesis protein (Chs5), putative [Talaromyces stipitatus ATCC 10500]EED19383.1 chitin biosynthesis protein (Chs5), putative [Talaromyces stipitatus ATCC 10500]
MLVSLTVGKVDAGVAVLLTQDNRLIEFPSVLLPKNISSGSIVDIDVSRNHAAEAKSIANFQALQKRILNTYGLETPSPPVLRLRNATQTSLVLEWDPIKLATASLKSLSLYRNGSKAGSIPRPLEMQSTKISGLAIHAEYTFHLVLRTTAGTYHSEKLTCRTHKMTDLSGITVTPGIMPQPQREALERALDRIGGKLVDTVRIDTTHFVCTEGRGPAWEKAVEMNLPVVRPEWVDACEAEGTIVGVRGYYLNADPKHRQLGPRQVPHQQQQQQPPPQQQQQAPELVVSETTTPPTSNQSNLPVRAPEPISEGPPTPFPGGPTEVTSTEVPEEHEADRAEPPSPPPKDEPSNELKDDGEEGPDESDVNEEIEDENKKTADKKGSQEEPAVEHEPIKKIDKAQPEGEGELEEVSL